MEKITKKEWEDFTAENACSSYNLVVNLAILLLWEAGVKNEEEANEFLMKQELDLSGAQAGMAIGYALSKDAEDWIDKTMAKIIRTK